MVMETPHAVRQYIEALQEDESRLTDESRKLIEICLRTLPQLPEHGKVCPMCARKCFHACRVCPHCAYRIKPKKRRIEAEQVQPPRMRMRDDDCQECLQLIQPDQLRVLSCNCKYHIECLKKKANQTRKSRRVCFGCDKRTPVPDEYRNTSPGEILQ